MAARVVLTHTFQQAALAETTRRACVLAEPAHVPWSAGTGPVVFVARSSVVARGTALLTALTPGTLRTQVLTVFPCRPRWTQTLARHLVTQGPCAVTGLGTGCPEPALWTVLFTVVSAATVGALALALSGHVVT